MDQEILRQKLKNSRMIDKDFSYQDIADMLQIKIGSMYNWLNGAYSLSYSKARELANWISDREE